MQTLVVEKKNRHHYYYLFYPCLISFMCMNKLVASMCVHYLLYADMGKVLESHNLELIVVLCQHVHARNRTLLL